MAENKEEIKKFKSIANCKPSEFLRQTNAIRHYVEKWMKDVEFAESWKRSRAEKISLICSTRR